MSLRKQAERDLESILDATNHTGFKLILREFEQMHTYLTNSAPDQCDTAEKWYQRRGEIAMVRKFLAIAVEARSALEALPSQRFDDEPAVPQTNELED